MPALLDVALRPAQPADHKVSQTFFRSFKIFGGIHRAEQRVVRDLRVELPNQATDAIFADTCEDLGFPHTIPLP